MTADHRVHTPSSVLFITPWLNIGGEELSTMGLIRGLMQRGHLVRYMSSGGPLLEELRRKGIHYLPGRVDGRGPRGIFTGAVDVRKALTSNPTDIVHASEPRPALMGFLASRCVFPRHSVVVWHDRGTMSHLLSARLFNLFADFVITNSESERQKLLRNGLRPDKVRTIHNFVYLLPPGDVLDRAGIRTTWGLNGGDPVVGIVARLISRKGHRYFLEAARNILDGVPRARFLIVGDGPLGAELRRMAQTLEIEARVVFTGFQREELPSLYTIMDVVAVPSTYEPFGNACLEAMAFGKPVVASNVDGIPEVVVDGQTGLLVPPRDSESLGKAVSLLLRDKHLAEQMGTAGRQRVREYFTRDRAINELEETYALISPHDASV